MTKINKIIRLIPQKIQKPIALYPIKIKEVIEALMVVDPDKVRDEE